MEIIDHRYLLTVECCFLQRAEKQLEDILLSSSSSEDLGLRTFTQPFTCDAAVEVGEGDQRQP